MVVLTIEVQPFLAKDPLALENMMSRLFAMDEFYLRDEGGEAGADQWIHITFKTDGLKSLWERIQRLVRNDDEFTRVAIVIAQGPSGGWDDHYLLYHFDSTEKIDTIE